MENRHLIPAFDPSGEWASFVCGDERATAAGIAWTLESLAVTQGWPTGVSIGTESDLMKRFTASRELVRQTVRILESRGSMRMQRGTKGGLYLVQTNVDVVASGLVLYLRAWGVPRAELASTFELADASFAELGHEHVVSQLYACARDVLLSDKVIPRAEAGRGLMIANGFVQQFAPVSEAGAYLGSEAQLCESFSSCRSTFRQALRVLSDLGMLRVKRGRAGGYWLKQPSPMGVMRQIFSLLGSHHQQLEQVVPATCALNLVQLRLVMKRSAEQRAPLCESLRTSLERSEEPIRWAMFQHALAEHAGNKLIACLQRSLVIYQARLGPPAVDYASIAPALRAAELAIVEALAQGADDEAIQLQRDVQDQMSDLLGCPKLSRVSSDGSGLRHAQAHRRS